MGNHSLLFADLNQIGHNEEYDIKSYPLIYGLLSLIYESKKRHKNLYKDPMLWFNRRGICWGDGCT